MAWVAVETFNTYSDGNLDGDNGGTGWASGWANQAVANLTVQGTTTYEGAKAISYNNAVLNCFYTRPLSSGISDSGTLYVALRRTANNAGNLSFTLRNSSNGGRVSIVFNASGNVVASGTTVVSGYSTNTWYVFRITLNVTGSKFKVASSTGSYHGGGSFGSDSADINMSNSGDIDTVGISSDAGSVTDYYDYISPTDPLPNPTSIKTVNGLAKVSVKTFNGLAIASVKSINGLQ